MFCKRLSTWIFFTKLFAAPRGLWVQGGRFRWGARGAPGARGEPSPVRFVRGSAPKLFYAYLHDDEAYDKVLVAKVHPRMALRHFFMGSHIDTRWKCTLQDTCSSYVKHDALWAKVLYDLTNNAYKIVSWASHSRTAAMTRSSSPAKIVLNDQRPLFVHISFCGIRNRGVCCWTILFFRSFLIRFVHLDHPSDRMLATRPPVIRLKMSVTTCS